MKKVLIIDDDESCRKLVSTILGRAGFDVCVAINGIDGMNVYRKEQPDVVITDLIMPEKEGIETIMELRKMAPELAIVAISGGCKSGKIDYLPAARSLGASASLAKPFDSEELLDAVNSSLEATKKK